MRLRLCVAMFCFVLPLSAFADDAMQIAHSQRECRLASWLHGEGITGNWFGARATLSDRGYHPYAIWTGEFLSNVHGGLETTTEWNGLLEFGIDVDLEEAAGWTGLTIHASAVWIQGGDDPSTDFVGNFDLVSNIAGVATVRLYRLYVEQALFGGAFSYKLGQLVLDDDFMTSDGSALFVNASYGPLPIESVNIPAPIYPLGALGGWAAWKPTDDSYFQLGIYDGDAGTQESNDDGFDYHLGGAEGVAILLEAGIDASLFKRDGTYKLGGYFHSGEFTEFASGRTVSDNYGLYTVVDQVLSGTRDDNRLAAFFRAGISPLDDRSEVDWYFDLGVTTKGVRDGDRVGLAFGHAHFSDDFVASAALTGSPVTDAESMIELTYLAQATPWLTLQPDLQFVIDAQDKAAADAIVIGLRAKVIF